jgi:hypothetical protein
LVIRGQTGGLSQNGGGGVRDLECPLPMEDCAPRQRARHAFPRQYAVALPQNLHREDQIFRRDGLDKRQSPHLALIIVESGRINQDVGIERGLQS